MGIDFLKVLHHPNNSRIPEFTNILAKLHTTELTHPTEELLLDILETEFITTVLQIAPTLVDQEAECPTDWTQLTWYDFWDISTSIVDRDTFQALAETISFASDQEDFWKIYENQSYTLQTDEFKKLVPILHNLDLYSTEFSSPVHTIEPYLKTLAHPEFSQTISAYHPEEYTPLTWIGQLLLDDTLQRSIELLQWLNERLSLLGANEDMTSE